ncbi:diguanylate cyclase (GGDEF) domain-containing protein [Thermanaerovibrio velox DSM 12556]|uniref:Diguanylate cyclase (GGDEF) domain-containing protein n=1 Tax=Thermanaerovibrio velox DSM 12556 TaxID=926567 RepID=H0UPC6_9BACT|nr:diguanylate cyclase [Thermanaerovibrio velox]EHM10557.1 diguanylate cyclase (GGDEF) domain-containing protein [Thermanaerovibrio velox DSM 12556]
MILDKFLNPNSHTIALAEDSPTQGRGLKSILEKEGFNVLWFRDGQEALEHIKSMDQPPSIIISDVVMPRMDGFELVRNLKSHEATKNIPTILLTALSDPIEVINGLKAGADNFLVKPSSPEQILKQVFYLINQSNLGDYDDYQARVVLEVNFSGQVHQITAHKMQIVNLIFSLIDSSSASAQKLSDLLFRQQQLEEDRRTLFNNLQHVLGSMDDGIIVVDPSGQAVYSNSSAQAIMGEVGAEGLLASLPEGEGEIRFTLQDGSPLVLDVKHSTVLWDGVQCRMSVLRDVTELVILRDQLKTQAVTDALTGLYNRRGFTEAASIVLKQAKEACKPVSMIYMDLDGFKNVNDTLGHHAGDQLLEEMAQAMRESFRSQDLLGRIGGDEFACFLLHQEGLNPEELIHRLEARLTARHNAISVSYGISHDQPGGSKTLEEMMIEADRAMYQHKEGKKASRMGAYA